MLPAKPSRPGFPGNASWQGEASQQGFKGTASQAGGRVYKWWVGAWLEIQTPGYSTTLDFQKPQGFRKSYIVLGFLEIGFPKTQGFLKILRFSKTPRFFKIRFSKSDFRNKKKTDFQNPILTEYAPDWDFAQILVHLLKFLNFAALVVAGTP